MTRRDVDLVIRARDQAQGAIKSITTALEKFVGQQDDIQAAAAGTDNAIDRLGTSLAGLQKALGATTAGDRVTAELTRAKAATDKLRDSTAKATGEAIGYTRESRAAARATQELRQESERIAQAVTRQAAAVGRAETAQKRLNSLNTRAAADRQKLAAADEKLTNQIEEQRLKLSLASRAFSDLQAQINRTAGPTETLEKRLSSISRTVRTTRERLDDLRTTQAVVQNSFDATARSVQRANDLYGRSAAGLDKQVAALTKLRATQSRVNDDLQESVRYQRGLEQAAERAANSLAQQDAKLEQAEAGYRELQTAALGVNQALAGLEGRVRGPLLRAFGEQAQRVQQLQQEYRETSGEATRLGRTISQLRDPSESLIIAFTRNQEAAARAREAYRLQQQELGRLRQILRETGGDVDTFANRQERFQSTLARAGAAYTQYGQASRQAAAASERAATAANRAAGTADNLGRGFNRAARDARNAARETNGLSAALRQFYGESRTALSFTQRLRSEVLALVAAYAGFFGAIRGIQNVVRAYQTLEAAQSRLNVVFEGSEVRTAQEFDFIRRTAELLGVELGSLANEYSKFAVATKGTNLEGENTRKIFTSVAEAARVNKATLPELRGIFVALTQIVNKGTVSMEELRQQLGERLPGAVNIMAEAADVTTAELTKMLEQGQLSSDVLVKFADVLDDRFGSQLPAALETSTTAFGRFQNALFQAFVRIANGGFIERVTALFNDLTDTLQSAQFESFLDRLSVALGTGADAVAFLARNFDILAAAITAFIAFKLSPFIVAIASSMGLLTGSTVSATRGFRALTVAVNTGAVSMTRAQVAARGATIALRGLLSATGIGLAVTVIGAGIGAWATRTDEATEALNLHQTLVDDVRNAYDRVGGSVEKWADRLEETTQVNAASNLERLTLQLDKVKEAFEDSIPRNILGGASGAGGGYFRAVDALFERFKQGELSATEFREALDDISAAMRDQFPVNANFADQFDELAGEIVKASERAEEARDIFVAVFTEDENERRAALRRLAGEVDSTGDDLLTAAEKAERFQEALEQLRDLVPSLKAELERMDEVGKLNNALAASLKLAQNYRDVAAAFNLYLQGLGQLGQSQFAEDFGPASSLVSRIINVESGGNPAARNPNSTATGLGQFIESTWLRLFKQNFPDRAQGLTDGAILALRENADLNRQMVELYLRENAEHLQRAGVAITDANLYLAHFLGPNGAARLIRSASGTLANDVLSQDAINSNQSILDGRTREEIIRWAERKVGLSQQELALQENFIDAELRRIEKEREERQKAAEATRDTIAANDRALAQEQLLLEGKEREAAIQEAINQAKLENADITDEELDKIRQQAAALFDVQKAREEQLTALEQAEEAEQRVNDLLTLRTQLTEQLIAAQQAGAGTDVTGRLAEGLDDVNVRLEKAVDNALRLFTALNSTDPAVQAIISRLETLRVRSGTVSQKIVIDWREVENVFANGLTTAFETFSKSVAEGKSISESARDAFLQFAADFLLQIARMIQQQIAFNIARSIFGGLGVASPLFHSGGVVGASSGVTRRVHPAVFANAMRYHGGGIAGLRAGEVPAILQRNEEVLTTSDPRHAFNGAGRLGGQDINLTSITTFDPAEAFDAALSTPAGQRVLFNEFRRRRREYSSLLVPGNG